MLKGGYLKCVRFVFSYPSVILVSSVILHCIAYFLIKVLFSMLILYVSLCVRKPTICILTRSDTNQPVQLQKQARSLKFQI